VAGGAEEGGEVVSEGEEREARSSLYK